MVLPGRPPPGRNEGCTTRMSLPNRFYPAKDSEADGPFGPGGLGQLPGQRPPNRCHVPAGQFGGKGSGVPLKQFPRFFDSNLYN